MKDSEEFAFHHRLATCTPGTSEEFIGLQAADYVAYETFRLMHDKRFGQNQMRHALNTMLETTKFHCEMFGKEALERVKDAVDAKNCGDNNYIIHPVPFGWGAQ
jgi:hypothetical protein